MNKRLKWLALAALVLCAGGILFRTPRALAKRALSPILKHALGGTKKHQTPALKPTRPLIIGYNLDFPGDWSNLMPFIDLMHDARPWAGCCAEKDRRFDATAHLDLDAQGWPRSLRYRDLPSQSYGWIETVFSTQESVPDIGNRLLG